MNAVSIPVLAMAAITLYVGAYHGFVYLRRRDREDLTFAITCLVVALYDLCCIGVYESTSVAEGVEWQRIQVAMLALFGVAFLWFAADYTGFVSRRVLWVLSCYFLFAAVFGLLDRSGLSWRVDVPSIKQITLPFGPEVTYYEATPGPFVLVQSVIGLISFGYILWIALRLRQSGQHRKALPFVASMSLFFAGLFNDTAVSAGVYPFIYLIEYAYLSMIVLMAFRLSTDLVEAVEVKQALASSEERLRQAQKMESIGRLAGGIAHDFNNMLTPILGYSTLSIRSLPEGDPLRENLVDIRDAAQEAADLTRQLLAFSRQQVLEMKVIDLNQVISEFEPILRRLIREDVDMVFRLDPTLESTHADPTQVRQIAMNLALNARDAMPEGGTLEFRTSNWCVDEGDEWHRTGVKPGDYVMLTVVDSGDGMDPETVRQLFEPFFTTKEQGKGTGLGLATIHGIVNQHGGHVSVDSELGRGTTFRILLPQADELPEVEAVYPAPSQPAGGRETILIVEDDRKVRGLAQDILEGQGYRVIVAESVEFAARIMSERETQVDLLLSDVVMPQMNGFELHTRISAIRPEIRVVYMSGYSEEMVEGRGALARGAPFLRKPFSPDDLAREVRAELDADRR
ncbi:MAG: response regulator [Deltaproteobacteria bacterium]|nr:response regulator [Deltaproteobacteria bacterium]